MSGHDNGQGYEVADDDKSIGNAVSAFLGDSAFEG
jgi:hypothetical protein